MLDLCLNNSLPTSGDHHNFMHLRPQDITTYTINVKGSCNMNNNPISNLDLSNQASDLSNFRFNFTDTHNPPQAGEIYCASDILLLPNPQTLRVSKTSRMGHHFDLAEWTSIVIIDIHNTVIYQSTIDDIVNNANDFEITVTFGSVLGNPVSVLGATLELRYSSSVGSVEWVDVQNKPAEYAPSAHIHMWNDIENPPATMPPSAHQHVVADITDFPTIPTDPSPITLDPTGFDHPELIVINYDSVTRKITLSGAGWKAYWHNTEVVSLINGWVSAAHDDLVGNSFFLYYNGTNFVWSTSPWTFDMLQIAEVNYESGYKFAVRESHGLMPWTVHRELHQTIGTYIVSGADLTNYTLSSTTPADRRPDISQTVLADEDLQTTSPQLLKTDNASLPYSVLYLTGSAVDTIVTNQAEIDILNTGVLRYNLNTGGTWSLVDITNNSYGKIFVIAIPATSDAASQKFRYIFTVPQQISGSLTTIQSVGFSTMVLPNFKTPEYFPIAEIIVRQQNSGWTLISVNKLTGTKQQLMSSAVGLTSVSTDNVTIFGNGTPSNPLRTAVSFPYTFGSAYTHPTTPTVVPGEFYLDATNHYILISKTDNRTNSHSSALTLLGYGSQITIPADIGKTNRYSILLSDIQADYVQYLYGPGNSSIEDLTIYNGNYEIGLQFNPIYTMDHLQDVDTTTNPLSDGQVLTYDSLLGWTNETPAGGGGGGGILPFAEITWNGSASFVVSQYNIGDGSILNNAAAVFKSNNSSLPINPTWSQFGTYPGAMVYNANKVMCLKVDWNIEITDIPAQTFEIMMSFKDGTSYTIDNVIAGKTNYSGSNIYDYNSIYSGTILLFLSIRCTTALNQTITLKRFNYTVSCDRSIT